MEKVTYNVTDTVQNEFNKFTHNVMNNLQNDFDKLEDVCNSISHDVHDHDVLHNNVSHNNVSHNITNNIQNSSENLNEKICKIDCSSIYYTTDGSNIICASGKMSKKVFKNLNVTNAKMVYEVCHIYPCFSQMQALSVIKTYFLECGYKYSHGCETKFTVFTYDCYENNSSGYIEYWTKGV